MTKRFDGKVVLITGGTGGIGKVTAKMFLDEGAKVAIVGTNEEKLDKAKNEMEGILTIKADVSKEEDVKNFVDKTVKEYGTIDVFFNNAGIIGKIEKLEDQDMDEVRKVIDINILGVFMGMKHVIPVMRKNGGGSIINTASVDALRGSPSLSPYAASKHAVLGLTKTAAIEVANDKIRVNSIHPSPVDTDMMREVESSFNKEDPAAAKAEYEQGVPLGRYATAEDVANLVLFLGSDESEFITGSQIKVDGGMLA